MKTEIKKCLSGIASQWNGNGPLFLPDVAVDAETVKVVMINEVVPADPADDFYGKAPAPDYLKTMIPLFEAAGLRVKKIDDILSLGVYITNAVKSPKSAYTIETETIKSHLPLLEAELALFPNLQVVMLMGDVAKKAFNLIAKKQTGKPAIPAGSTYKLRKDAFFCGEVRVFPSYIMTGGNILIEKSKFAMATEDIRAMAVAVGLLHEPPL